MLHRLRDWLALPTKRVEDMIKEVQKNQELFARLASHAVDAFELQKQTIATLETEVGRLKAEQEAMLRWVIVHDKSGYWRRMVPSVAGEPFKSYEEAVASYMGHVTKYAPGDEYGDEDA